MSTKLDNEGQLVLCHTPFTSVYAQRVIQAPTQNSHTSLYLHHPPPLTLGTGHRASFST